ncbi:MAG TPA: PfkB family carbohydrate kinase [Candidatus Thermoplasmatota archaeon]
MPFLGVYGHVNVDYILQVKELPRAEQTVPVIRELVRLGGTAGNIARGAAFLSVPTAIASCVGEDFPPRFREELTAAGIDLVDFRQIPGPTPKIWIISSAKGEQSAVIDQGVMGDNHSRPRLDYTMLGSDWIHFTTGPAKDHFDIAKEASRIGKKVVFDPGQELSYRYPERDFERFLDLADVFICNKQELGIAQEKLGYGDPKQLLDHVDAIIGTRGSEGSVLYTERETININACPVRTQEAVDTVAAGDLYRAGLYAALREKRPLPEAMRWAAVAASVFLESHGTRWPSLDDVRRRRDEWGD